MKTLFLLLAAFLMAALFAACSDAPDSSSSSPAVTSSISPHAAASMGTVVSTSTQSHTVPNGTQAVEIEEWAVVVKDRAGNQRTLYQSLTVGQEEAQKARVGDTVSWQDDPQVRYVAITVLTRS